MADIVTSNACKCNQFDVIASYNRLLQLLFVSSIHLKRYESTRRAIRVELSQRAGTSNKDIWIHYEQLIQSIFRRAGSIRPDRQ